MRSSILHDIVNTWSGINGPVDDQINFKILSQGPIILIENWNESN